jgi:hypothetical protein
MITKEWTLIAGVVGLSFASGAGVSYLLTKRNLEAKYEMLLEEQITLAKEFYGLLAKRDIDKAKALNKKDQYSTPTEALKEYKTQISEYDQALEQTLTEEEHQDDWNQEEEERSRSLDAPYVIHRDEFVQGQQNYDKICLTYYEKDDVVFDDRTTPLVDVDILIGESNLKRFGDGSGKKDVVFVRCDHIETDWEITRSHGDYVEEVLGGIRHSDDHRKTKKFRLDDG